MKDDTEKTIKDFGEQWQAFRDNPGFYGEKGLLFDVAGSLLAPEALRGARVLEIGSGTGRIVHMLVEAGAKQVYALEPSDAMEVMQENMRAVEDRIVYLKKRGDEIPSDLALDYIFSIGVIHHIPDPTPVLASAYKALRPGGKILIWIYGKEGNELYLAFAKPLRAITKHLPHIVLSFLAWLLYLALECYIFFCRFIPLPMHVYMKNVLGRFPHSVRYMTIYDQLNPAHAKYYTKKEAESLLTDAGFKDVELFHRHGYSWSVIGTKP